MIISLLAFLVVAKMLKFWLSPVPAESWVCIWIGTSGNSLRRDETRSVAALGFKRPAMSFTAKL